MNAKLFEWDEEALDEWLDGCYDEVHIGSLTFSPSEILKRCDPTAYWCSFADMPEEYQCSHCQCRYEDEEEAEQCCAGEWAYIKETWTDCNREELIATEDIREYIEDNWDEDGGKLNEYAMDDLVAYVISKVDEWEEENV